MKILNGTVMMAFDKGDLQILQDALRQYTGPYKEGNALKEQEILRQENMLHKAGVISSRIEDYLIDCVGTFNI